MIDVVVVGEFGEKKLVIISTHLIQKLIRVY